MFALIFLCCFDYFMVVIVSFLVFFPLPLLIRHQHFQCKTTIMLQYSPEDEGRHSTLDLKKRHEVKDLFLPNLRPLARAE